MKDAERIRRWFELAYREERAHPTLALHLKDAALRVEQLSLGLAHMRASLTEWLDGVEMYGGAITLSEGDIAQRIRQILEVTK